MVTLSLVTASDGPDIAAFEWENRNYFARSISDRGDAYFTHFDEEFMALLESQENGLLANYLARDPSGALLGRFNLYHITNGTADVGYRMAEAFTGRGLATAGLIALCQRAATEHHLHTLVARTSETNVASQRVLERAGFLRVGAADPTLVGGKAGYHYERNL